MTEDKPQDPSADEPFLARWSRRKSGAREDAGTPAADAPRAEAERPAADLPPGEPALPDIESLGEDSDYSAFLSPKVDEGLRRQALRKLFRSPKFNVCDGLDDYCGDFTRFDALGDLITADMRHHLERAARAVERLAAEEGSVPAETDASAASSAAVDVSDRPDARTAGQEPDDDLQSPS